MEKCLLLISVFIISTLAMADQTSDTLNSIYNTTVKELCNRAVTEKCKEKTYSKLILKNTKLDGLCLLTTESVMNQCFEKSIEFYSPYAKSPDKVRANNILSNISLISGSKQSNFSLLNQYLPRYMYLL